MGGYGSGRRYSAKDTTDDYRSIDVRRWKRDGLLDPPSSFLWRWSRNGETIASIRVHTEHDRVILTYRHRSVGEEWNDVTYPVYLDWTDCHFGGRRPWFLCPASGCGRRVAKLWGGTIFACRHCYDLAYPCQREVSYDRAARRADKIRERLGWEPGIFNGNGGRPRGMHWTTFQRLANAHDAFAQRSFYDMSKLFGWLA